MTESSARFFVVGSNSFSGSHFVAKLLSSGHTVLGVSRSPEVSLPFRPYAWRQRAGSFEFKQADINDASTMRSLLQWFEPEIVVNFGAQSMVAESWIQPEHWYRTNVLGLAEFAKALGDLTSLVRYVHVTTPEVYGSTRGWIKETRDFHPSTPYAVSRAAGDMHLYALFEARGLPVCFTRAANVYGPGQQLYRIVPKTLLSARLDRKVTLDGAGRSTRSFIHITDVVEATYRLSLSGVPGRTYHISTDEIVSIRELVERACVLTQVKFANLVKEGPERPGKDDTYMLNSQLIRREQGWTPQVNLNDGLRDTLGWIDANLGELAQTSDTYVHKE